MKQVEKEPQSDVDRLRELLLDLRSYTAQVEGALAPFIITRSYVTMPKGHEQLKRRLDAELGPLTEDR